MKLAIPLLSIVFMVSAATAAMAQPRSRSVVIDKAKGEVTLKVQLSQPKPIETARVFGWVPRSQTPGAPWKRIYLQHKGNGEYSKTVKLADRKLDATAIERFGVAFGAAYAKTVNGKYNNWYRPTNWFQGPGDNVFPMVVSSSPAAAPTQSAPN